MILKNADVFIGGRFAAVDIRVSGGIIVEVGDDLTGGDVTDCGGMYIIPGLVDIHTHGCVGYDFSTASVAEMGKMSEYYIKNGITSVLATLMTMPRGDYVKAAGNVYTAIAMTGYNNILGINMEGPFLGADKRGAHSAEYLLPPDMNYFDEIDNAANGNIKIVDVDPCYNGALDFIRSVAGKKTISLAHTSCTYDMAVSAFESGAVHITHLFNAMNPLHHREPGLIGAFCDYIHKGVTAELICDKHHIHPAVIRLIFSLAAKNTAIISDSMSAAGLGDGTYILGGNEVIVENGKATNADGTLAGSAYNLFECMINAVKCGVPIEQAITSATEIPARIAGAGGKIGAVGVNMAADLVVLDGGYNIWIVLKNGELVFRSL